MLSLRASYVAVANWLDWFSGDTLYLKPETESWNIKPSLTFQLSISIFKTLLATFRELKNAHRKPFRGYRPKAQKCVNRLQQKTSRRHGGTWRYVLKD
jgi:hypothetical protein